MEKLKMHSPDLVAGNFEKIAALFPNCITEAQDATGKLIRAVDFDLLKQELSGSVVEGPQERYRLDWPGKKKALLHSNAPIAHTLRPNHPPDELARTSHNLFIEGENLAVLKLLQECYLSKVKVIFIDPPYNTGDDLIYDDDYSENIEEYLITSSQKAPSGERLTSNPETDGRFHSKWLSMMYPRLRLAKNLLDEDGIICVAISDIELANAKALLAEIFGEANYVNTVNILAKVAAGASGGGEDKRLKKNIEYIVIFAKRFDAFNTLTHLYTKRPLMDVVHEMRDAEESWKYTSILLGAGERSLLTTTVDGDGQKIEIYKRKNLSRTTISKVCKDEKISEQQAYNKYFSSIFSDTNAQTSIRSRVIDAAGELDDDEILEVEYTPRSGRDKGTKVKHTYISKTVRRVIWLSDVAEISGSEVIKREKIGTLWNDFDYNNVGKEGGIPFPDGKKPIELIKRCIKLYANNTGIILDFFAGSCSTAHAVMDLNREDEGSRRFIMIQMPSPIDADNKKYESAVKFYKEAGIDLNISAIGQERIIRAAKSADQINGTLYSKPERSSFRILKLDSSNFEQIHYTPDRMNRNDLLASIDNIKLDRTPQDLLFQVMLDRGLDLGLPISSEKIAGKTVFFVDGNALAACFDIDISEELVTALAKRRVDDLPLLKVILRDAGYADDSAKINVEQIFKLISPTTELRTL